MYIVKFAVASTSNIYAFTCFSKTITVQDTDSSTDSSASSGLPPNFIFKFDGDLTVINSVLVKANLFNYVHSSGVTLSGMEVYSGSVYLSGYSTENPSSLINRLSSSGVTIDSGLSFVYLSVNDALVRCSECVILVSQTTESADEEETKKKEVVEIAIGAIVGGTIGGLVAVLFIILGVIALKKFKKSQRGIIQPILNQPDTSILLIESETKKIYDDFDEQFNKDLPGVSLPKQLDSRDFEYNTENPNVVIPAAIPAVIDNQDISGGEFDYENWLANANKAIEEKKKSKKKKKEKRSQEKKKM